jgi:hypothetical protein
MTPQQVDALENFLFFLAALIAIPLAWFYAEKRGPPPLGVGVYLAGAWIFRAPSAENSARSIQTRFTSRVSSPACDLARLRHAVKNALRRK